MKHTMRLNGARASHAPAGARVEPPLLSGLPIRPCAPVSGAWAIRHAAVSRVGPACAAPPLRCHVSEAAHLSQSPRFTKFGPEGVGAMSARGCGRLRWRRCRGCRRGRRSRRRRWRRRRWRRGPRRRIATSPWERLGVSSAWQQEIQGGPLGQMPWAKGSLQELDLGGSSGSGPTVKGEGRPESRSGIGARGSDKVPQISPGTFHSASSAKVATSCTTGPPIPGCGRQSGARGHNIRLRGINQCRWAL